MSKKLQFYAAIRNFAGRFSGVVLICVAGFAAAYGLQMRFAGPWPEEYASIAGAGGNGWKVVRGPFFQDGLRFQCRNYPTLFLPALGDYAAAFFGFVIVNPARFKTLPVIVKRFAFAHECGHQYAGYSEIAADCYAARLGRKEGWLNEQTMGEVCAFFSASKGSPFHLPGPQRCEAIRRCYANGDWW